jgi:hypothetical protein
MNDPLTQARRAAHQLGIRLASRPATHNIGFSYDRFDGKPDERLALIPMDLISDIERDLGVTFNSLDRELICDAYNDGFVEERGKHPSDIVVRTVRKIGSRIMMSWHHTVRVLGTAEEIALAGRAHGAQYSKGSDHYPPCPSASWMIDVLRKAGLGGKGSTLRVVDRTGHEHYV